MNTSCTQPAKGPHGGNMTNTWDEEDRGSLAPAPKALCPLHPAFYEDHCLPCGTARPVGMTTEQALRWAEDNK